VVRPFIGTLSDEISVRPSDKVIVLRTFDDGWIIVEKSQDPFGVERGLIPAACLTEPSRSPPLSPKRVDSY
ncbi:hypothetical protein FA15DRAFT_556718, partial [Coprinopsis marcescibilis]